MPVNVIKCYRRLRCNSLALLLEEELKKKSTSLPDSIMDMTCLQMAAHTLGHMSTVMLNALNNQSIYWQVNSQFCFVPWDVLISC